MFSASHTIESRFPQSAAKVCKTDGTAMRSVYDGDFVALAPLPQERSAGVVLLALAMFPIFVGLGAKSLLLARLDMAALAEMLSRFEAMGPLGRALAWAMQPEAVTALLSQVLAGLLG
ncbi:hypothetical protein [uncultured Limimaricola sp.]|uniref:hypothetical protein n=1 Tax=uncultured Limimaricola sp. TaxID=2211667 RepID=UPI0030F96318